MFSGLSYLRRYVGERTIKIFRKYASLFLLIALFFYFNTTPRQQTY